MLEAHERAGLAGQFIEALLQVPVLCCRAGAGELEAGIKRFLPEVGMEIKMNAARICVLCLIWCFHRAWIW